MNEIIGKWIVFACIGTFSAHLNATLLFDDGATHSTNIPIFDDVLLENGSDLNVMQGSFIQPPSSGPAITKSYSPSAQGSSTINLSGNAHISGEIFYDGWGNDQDAVIATDHAAVVGQGEYSPGNGRGAVSGTRRVEVSGNSTLTGADNVVNGGSAINNTSSGAQLVSVDGGEIMGGDGGQNGGNGVNGWIETVAIDMTGGLIQGGNSANEGGDGIGTLGQIDGTISGGEITGGSGGLSGGDALYAGDGLSLDITGGQFKGGNGDSFGGNAMRARGGSPSTTNISGGSFDAGVGLLEDGWLLHYFGWGTIGITGGLFGYENVGNGIGIFNNAHVDVFGWDLNITDDLLTGFLMDGSWIETPISLAFNESTPLGTISLINYSQHPTSNVPEPSTLLLMAVGLVGIGITRSKKILHSK